MRYAVADVSYKIGERSLKNSAIALYNHKAIANSVIRRCRTLAANASYKIGDRTHVINNKIARLLS
ncbi:hypothetical protein AMR41_06505 [Hapalosiphon sp. MRB220]|nr:hypothetical protein AMR41_06505 [Hapalosiphon sp. MRB220]